MRLKVATWNINSVRLRSGSSRGSSADHAPDVLCLQETKCQDDRFPLRRLPQGRLRAHRDPRPEGLSRRRHRLALSFRGRDAQIFCGKADAGTSRHAGARSGDAAGVSIHNFYVPAGGDIPDAAVNEKFAHKLAFLDEMRDWCGADEPRRRAAPILVGDLNIAPLETRRLEPQAAPRRGVAYADRMRKVRPCRRRGGWVDADAHARPNPRRSSPGGATAPRSGRNPTAAGGSTMSGFRKASRRASPDTKIMRAAPEAGSGRLTTCP